MVTDLLTAPAPLPIAREQPSKNLIGRAVAGVGSAGVLLFLILNVWFRESYSGDEGFYGVTALNMLHSPEYILRPSNFPAGSFQTDKDAFAHPPFNSYFYALALTLTRGGLAGAELVNVVFFGLLLFYAYRVLSLFDVQAGRFAILLLVASPAIIGSYSQLEAEPLMTTAGVMGLYYALKGGFASGQRRLIFVGGLCIGLAFALKLWLCGPLAMAVAAALIVGARRSRIELRQAVATLLIFALGVIIPSAAHLLAIACFYPQDLSFWLNNIYFGFFTGAGISGSKAGAAGVPADWIHPIWYYGAVIYRDHFFLVPIILCGVGVVLRDEKFKGKLLWILFAGVAGILPLSLIKVKEPLYVLSAVVFLYLLAAACLAALIRLSASQLVQPRSVKVGAMATVGLLILFPLAWAKGIQPAKITTAFVIVHSLVLVAFLALLWLSRTKERFVSFEWAVCAACALALAATVGQDCFTRRPRDKTIAQLTRSYVQDNSPRALSVLSSDFKSYQLLSFRCGRYWHELPLAEGPEAVLSGPEFSTTRVFVLDPDDQAKPEMKPWLAWLESHGTEKTAELNAQLGAVCGYRLFVR